jgi:hypothetical protein
LLPVEGALGEIPQIAEREQHSTRNQNIKRNSQNMSCESESMRSGR